MVASRWPLRLPRAVSISFSTSSGVRCSRVRSSTFGRRSGVCRFEVSSRNRTTTAPMSVLPFPYDTPQALGHAGDDLLDLGVALAFDLVGEGRGQAPDRAGLLGQLVAPGAPARLLLRVRQRHHAHLPGSLWKVVGYVIRVKQNPRHNYVITGVFPGVEATPAGSGRNNARAASARAGLGPVLMNRLALSAFAQTGH